MDLLYLEEKGTHFLVDNDCETVSWEEKLKEIQGGSQQGTLIRPGF